MPDTNPLDAALARGFGKCRLSDLQRADLARWAYYNLGAQMTSQRPGDFMYPAAAYYARTGPRLPYVCKCGQLSGDEKVCDACRDLARAPQGEAVRLFTPAPTQLPGQEFFAVDVEPMPSRYRWTPDQLNL
jgi:hypothetical protein